MTSFAIVTVIHDSEPELPLLLDSIARLPEPHPRVIVVDSGSSDRGPELAAERGAELIRLDGNPGFGAGSNAGLERVTEPVTAFVNPDVELLDDGLSRLAPDASGGGALLAPRLLNADGSVQDSAHPLPGRVETLIPALLPRRLLPTRFEPWRSHSAREVGWAVAACILGRTDELRALGPFDPDAFLFYEDMELCLRARRAGIRTLLRPDVAVRHLGGASTSRALSDGDLDLRARRRREVVGQEGRGRLLIDDLAEGLTFGLRGAAKALVGSGQLERRRLGALLRARR
jgi:N-acetylglucosaminyl-diphospho-decaprenol L-rhamnosyltransferase